MNMVLLFKQLSLYKGYFVRQIQFFTKHMLGIAHSTIHALVLVQASTIPRDVTGCYKPLVRCCGIQNPKHMLRECTE